MKKPQRTKKKKVVTLSTLSRDIEDVNPEWYFFRCLFFYRAEISFVRRAKLFAHLEVLWITMAASRQPRRQPPMRYSTKCGLMLMVDGRFLFIAFQLETAAKSERRVERMLPLFFSFLEKRLIRFMAYRIKKKRNLSKYTLYVREYVFQCDWWLRFVNSSRLLYEFRFLREMFGIHNNHYFFEIFIKTILFFNFNNCVSIKI